MSPHNCPQLALPVGGQQPGVDGEPGRARRPDAGRRAEPRDDRAAAAAAGERAETGRAAGAGGQRPGERLALLGHQRVRVREAGRAGGDDRAVAAAEGAEGAAAHAAEEAVHHFHGLMRFKGEVWWVMDGPSGFRTRKVT